MKHKRFYERFALKTISFPHTHTHIDISTLNYCGTDGVLTKLSTNSGNGNFSAAPREFVSPVHSSGEPKIATFSWFFAAIRK